MTIFTSLREKKLWLWAFAVFAAIFSNLFIGQLITKIFNNQNTQAGILMFGMLLIGLAVTVHGLKTRPKKTEIAIWLGISAVYLLFFLRLGLAERSHLIEYSVLAIFIHKAFNERARHKKLPNPALWAILLSTSIGVIDEGIQLFLPYRVFDYNDILFNLLASTMAVGASLLIAWVKKRVQQ